jgi:thioredoxin 1
MNEWGRRELDLFFEKESSGLVYLYTPFCGTCQVSGKMLSVAAELLSNVEIGKINLNYMPDLAEKWKVESVPCLVFVNKGIVADKLYAFQSVPFLLEKIISHIEK